MIARARTTVIDLDHDRLTFVSGVVASGRVTLQSAGSAIRPAGVDVADAVKFGAWVGQVLRDAGIAGSAAGRVIVCVPRGNVVMKRLAFPGLESQDDPDLVEMVRLSMTRQMPMKVEGTAIDFIPLVRTAAPVGVEESGIHPAPALPPPGPGGSGASGEGEGPAIEVLACAFPGDRVAWCRAVVQAAGLKLGALTLRATGAATLLTQHADADQAPVLGVAIGWSSVEFIVVDDGEIVFVRSADVPLAEADDDPGQYAQRVSVEAKRSWMAYRVSPGSTSVGALVAVGAGDLGSEVARRCAEALELAPATCGLPSFVTAEEAGQGDGEVYGPGQAMSDPAAAPLIGLMVATASSRPIFDFAHPRKPPDRSAGVRRAALLVVLALIVVVGGALALATIQVDKARATAAAAEARARDLGTRVIDLRRADMRLKHLEQWLDADVDWLAHFENVTSAMPAPPSALLDSLSGTITRAEVLFEPGGSSSSRTYSGSKWGLDLQAVLHATGRLASRDIGNDFRQRLVADPTYVVESRGADTENRFDMNLVTRLAEPRPEAPAQSPGASARPGASEASPAAPGQEAQR